MKPKFEYNQFIIKLAHPVENVMGWPGLPWVIYGEAKDSRYGIFKVTPYKKNNYGNFPIEYKVNLVPVGSTSDMFFAHNYYTTDLRDIPENMIFNSLDEAEIALKNIA